MPTTNYQEIPRLYTALAEWGACFLYCMLMQRKVSNRKFAAISAGALCIMSLWLSLTDNVPLFLWLPCMLVAMALMFLYLYLVVKGTPLKNLYLMLKSFLVAEFAASLEWQIHYFGLEEMAKASGTASGAQLPDRAWLPGILTLVVVYGLVYLGVYLIEKGMAPKEFEMDITPKECLTAGMIVVLAFFISNLSFVYENTPFSSSFTTDIFNIRTLMDLVGLAILYAYQSRVFELSAEKDLNAINDQLAAQYVHYRNYQESINLINFKYHDLKHQLAGLRAETDSARRQEWIDTLEQELEVYKPETQTGNHVLDGVLDGKMAVIRNNHVKFTCVVDGALLDFLHVTDICTIFGNALDNAVESVLMVEDPEKRLVHMRVSAKKQLLCIEVSNYCDHPVKIKDGMPVTTKSDKRQHGFGVKSILYTAKKYGGNVNFSLSKGTFSLKVVIPIPEENQRTKENRK